MTLSQSMEDYLEAIFEIGRVQKAVRVKNVAEKLGVTMPSVNNALKNLEANGLIVHEKYEYIELTESGVTIAKQISWRHKLLSSFLTNQLGVPADTADREACSMEHVLSTETMRRLESFVRKADGGRS